MRASCSSLNFGSRMAARRLQSVFFLPHTSVRAKMDGRKERHVQRVSATHRDWALPRLDEKPRVAVFNRPPHADVVLIILQPHHQVWNVQWLDRRTDAWVDGPYH